MIRFTLEAPWYSYQKKVKALFAQDPDIQVGEVYEPDDGSADYAFDIEIRDHEKFVALDRVLAKEKRFGNVTLGICLFDEENTGDKDEGISLFTTIFGGNPILKDIKEVVDQAGVRHGYVRFRPEVIQFFDDDLRDFNGNWSGLAQDIAREVFSDGYNGIHFCTADVRENQTVVQEAKAAASSESDRSAGLTAKPLEE